MGVSLAEVAGWLKESSLPTTSYDRQQEIQWLLNEFQEDFPSSLQICLQYMADNPDAAAHSVGLWVYCIQTVQMAIVRNWMQLPLSDRLAVRGYLWQTFSRYSHNTRRMERDMIAQLIALIGQREFPDHHPGFVNELLELMHQNLFLGINLLRVISEEVTNSRPGCGVDQKKYFQSSLSHSMGEIMDVINKAMAIVVCKYLKTDVTGIPLEFKDLRLLRALPEQTIHGEAEMVVAIERITIELLDCIQHLFMWIPLQEHLQPFLLNSLFILTKWEVVGASNEMVPTAAMTSISELFYRQVAIPHPDIIANGIMQLLQHEAASQGGAPDPYKLIELLRLFTTQHTSKWIDDDTFPTLLWHLFQFTFNATATALAFTERLSIWLPIIKALLGPDAGHGSGPAAATGFRQYTELMMALLNGILEKMQFQTVANQQDHHLDLLDNSTLDEDLETEWQHFLTQCIEVIALLAEGRPDHVMEVIVNAWRVPFEVFFVIEKAIVGGDLQLDFMNVDRPSQASKCHYVHCILRDLSSLCQTFSRLAPTLEQCSARITEVVRTVAISLVLSVKFLATRRPYHLANATFTDDVQMDVIEAFAQTLSALKGIMPWAGNLKLESYISSLIDVVVPILVPAATPVESSQLQQPPEPHLIKMASANLLQSITAILRPQTFLESANVRQLMECGLDLYASDKMSGLMMYRAITNSFVLPWHGVVQQGQRFEERAKKLEEYLIKHLAHKYLAHCHEVCAGGSGGTGINGAFYSIHEMTMAVLTDIMAHCSDAGSIAKQMLAVPIKQVIEVGLQLFKRFPGHGQITKSIFQFLHACIGTLQIQLGNHYIKEMLSCLLTATMAHCNSSNATNGDNSFNCNNNNDSVNNNNNNHSGSCGTTNGTTTMAVGAGGNGRGNSAHSIEKLLEILCLIVKNSNATVQQVLLPSMLELTLDHIVPHLGQDSYWAHDTDIVSLIYTLFDGILLNHWQYFYKCGVLRKLKPLSDATMATPTAVLNGDGVSGAAETIQHQERFLAIMSLYGRALIAGDDPHVMDIVLRSLQRVNEHWKLYHKEVFQSQLLSSFQYALINALISPKGALCPDLMMQTLYTMGQVNMKRLHESFYMFGFSADNKLVQSICLTTDLPTFSHQMMQLIQDNRRQRQRDGAVVTHPPHKT